MRWVFRIFKWLGLGLSTVLLLATIVFWVRSIGHQETWTFWLLEHDRIGEDGVPTGPIVGRKEIIGVAHGRLWLNSVACSEIETLELMSSPPPGMRSHERKIVSEGDAELSVDYLFPPAMSQSRSDILCSLRVASLGVLVVRNDEGPPNSIRKIACIIIAVPFWMLTVLFALWPALFTTRRILRWRRRNFRIRHGLCLHCGYDLRATPERCPECGNAVETRANPTDHPITDP